MWNGSSWTNIGTGINGNVNSLNVYENELYIAGSFSNAAGTPVNNIAKYATTTGIQPVNAATHFLNVYPNPTSDFVQVSWTNKNSSPVMLVVSDIGGRILIQQNIGSLPAGFYQENIAVNRLSEGVYFLTMNAGVKRYVVKFEVTK